MANSRHTFGASPAAKPRRNQSCRPARLAARMVAPQSRTSALISAPTSSYSCRNPLTHVTHTSRMTIVKGMATAQNIQNWGLTLVAIVDEDVSSTEIKNCMPKKELTVEIGRKIIARTANDLMT